MFAGVGGADASEGDGENDGEEGAEEGDASMVMFEDFFGRAEVKEVVGVTCGVGYVGWEEGDGGCDVNGGCWRVKVVAGDDDVDFVIAGGAGVHAIRGWCWLRRGGGG